MGHEQRLAGHHALASTPELSHHAFVGLGAISQTGFKLDAFFHIGHGTGFSDDALAGVKFNLDQLQVITDNFEINFMTVHFVS